MHLLIARQPAMAAPHALLRTARLHWGPAFEFRPLQAEAVAATLAGQDVLIILPTGAAAGGRTWVLARRRRLATAALAAPFLPSSHAGGGKSLTFQLAPIYRNQVSVVVAPLLALAKDQVGVGGGDWGAWRLPVCTHALDGSCTATLLLLHPASFIPRRLRSWAVQCVHPPPGQRLRVARHRSGLVEQRHARAHQGTFAFLTEGCCSKGVLGCRGAGLSRCWAVKVLAAVELPPLPPAHEPLLRPPPTRPRIRAQDMMARELLADAEDGTLRLLFTTPESLAHPDGRLRRVAGRWVAQPAERAEPVSACPFTAARSRTHCRRSLPVHLKPAGTCSRLPTRAAGCAALPSTRRT